MSDFTEILNADQFPPVDPKLSMPTLYINAQSDQVGVKIIIPVIPDSMYGNEEELLCFPIIGANGSYFRFRLVPNYTAFVTTKKGAPTEITAMPGAFANAVRYFRNHAGFVNGTAEIFYLTVPLPCRSELLQVTLDFPANL